SAERRRDEDHTSLSSAAAAQMLHELARIGCELAEVADADGEVADRPGVGQRHGGDRHGPRHAPCGRLRHDADADIALYQPAQGIEEAQQEPQRWRAAHGVRLRVVTTSRRAGVTTHGALST